MKDDQEYTIEVKKRRKIRSLKQNNYYWFVLTYAAIHIGEYKEDLHHQFAKMFLPREITAPVTNRKVTIGRSTTGLDSYEMTMYIKKIKTFLLAKLDVNVPDPHNVDEEEFERVNKEYELMLAA